MKNISDILSGLANAKIKPTEQNKTEYEQALREYEAKMAELYENERVQRTEKLKKTLREHLNIPKRFSVAVSSLVTDGPWGDKIASLRRFVGKGGITTLVGTPGVGKTQMAVCLLLHAVDNLISAQYTRFSEIRLNIKKSFTLKDSSDYIDSLTNPRVLVIDEFDWMPSSRTNITDDFWQDAIYHIIDKRYGDMKDTILVSNKTAREFESTILPTIKSRMEETGGIVDMSGWHNWRQDNRG